jgi:heptose I phosphotransferase
MWLNPRYQTALARAHLANFQAVMACRDGYCLRALADRENWRLEIREGRAARGLYLKRHHFRTLQSWLRAKLGIGPAPSPAMAEILNVDRVHAAGIPVMEVVAYGEAFHGDGRVESFLLTEELSGYDDLRVFLRRRFAPRELARNTGRDRDLARLIGDTAEFVRRFHAAGYNHRDLYCCHLFVREPAAGRFEFRMIDLQRVQHRRRLRRRWIVKDLAQLAWSIPRDRVTCTQKLAFIRRYLGVTKLRPRDKRLIREVLAKQQIMERNLGIES